jgi:hypothetical protein
VGEEEQQQQGQEEEEELPRLSSSYCRKEMGMGAWVQQD